MNLLRGHGTAGRYVRGCRCIACKAAHAEYQRLWMGSRPDKRRDYDRRYQDGHPGKRAARYQAHSEEVIAQVMRWRAEHPEKAGEYRRNRRAREAETTGRHTAADVRAQYARQKGRCYWCKEVVGDTQHVDHVVPLILGGSNGPENIVVACPHCNLSKNAKHPMDFAGVLC